MVLLGSASCLRLCDQCSFQSWGVINRESNRKTTRWSLCSMVALCDSIQIPQSIVFVEQGEQNPFPIFQLSVSVKLGSFTSLDDFSFL